MDDWFEPLTAGNSDSMRVLVTGATGYIGGRLVPRLHDAGVEVRCVARAAGRLRGRFGERVEIVEGNLDDAASLVAALNSCDVAYYLVHSMAATADYAEVDRQTAQRFGAAAREAGVKAIVYLGGLGDDRDALSTHLRSRHEVGEVLRESGVPVIEFRAAQIIGSGSISFEMMRYLTERLPLMIAPRWVTTRCQPIGIRDVLAYLVAALSLPRESRIYEIGGSDVLTYREMMLRYAAIRGLKRRVVVVPFFSPTLSSYWVHLITPVPAKLAQPLIKGLYNEVVVRESAAVRDFPQIAPMGFDDAVRLALDRSQSFDREFDLVRCVCRPGAARRFRGSARGNAHRPPRGRGLRAGGARRGHFFIAGRKARLVRLTPAMAHSRLAGSLGRRRRSASGAAFGERLARRRRRGFLACRSLRAGALIAFACGNAATGPRVAPVRSRAARRRREYAGTDRVLRASRRLGLSLLVCGGTVSRLGLRHDGETHHRSRSLRKCYIVAGLPNRDRESPSR